jgi:hypothetical protein
MKNEQSNIFKYRTTPEQRVDIQRKKAEREVREYIRNGSQGDLNLRDTPIQSLPDNLTVNGNLNLFHCKNLKSLPDNLTVGGSLDLNDTSIQSLPDNLTVGGSLYLPYTQIQ